VTFYQESDPATRCYLDAQGMRKGDLSRFIEDAVRRRMFDSAVQAVKARNVELPAPPGAWGIPTPASTTWSVPTSSASATSGRTC
jgi:hypothetical protein